MIRSTAIFSMQNFRPGRKRSLPWAPELMRPEWLLWRRTGRDLCRLSLYILALTLVISTAGVSWAADHSPATKDREAVEGATGGGTARSVPAADIKRSRLVIPPGETAASVARKRAKSNLLGSKGSILELGRRPVPKLKKTVIKSRNSTVIIRKGFIGGRKVESISVLGSEINVNRGRGSKSCTTIGSIGDVPDCKTD